MRCGTGAPWWKHQYLPLHDGSSLEPYHWECTNHVLLCTFLWQHLCRWWSGRRFCWRPLESSSQTAWQKVTLLTHVWIAPLPTNDIPSPSPFSLLPSLSSLSLSSPSFCAGDDVCGVSVRIRGFDQNVIQIWNENSELHSKATVRDTPTHITH